MLKAKGYIFGRLFLFGDIYLDLILAALREMWGNGTNRWLFSTSLSTLFDVSTSPLEAAGHFEFHD